MSVPEGENPGSSRLTFSTERRTRAVVVRRTTARVTAAATSASLSRPLRLPVPPLGAPRREGALPRIVSAAGRSAKKRIGPKETARPRVSARPSSVIESARGSPSGRIRRKPLSPTWERRIPRTPATAARTAASVRSSWRTRLRPAPSARRSAISPVRDVPRARRRFATLTQAIRRTSSPPTIVVTAPCWNCGPRKSSSRIPLIRKVRSALVCG